MQIFPRLAALYARYRSAHRDIRRRGPALKDARGRRLGHVDVIRLRGNRLHVEGWAHALRVTLEAGGAEVSARPALLRQDVSDALGGPPEVGFHLQLATAAERPRLTLALDGGGQHSVLLRRPGGVRAGLGLALRFALALAAAAPALLRWQLRQDARALQQAKARLGLQPAPACGVLDPAPLGLPERPNAPSAAAPAGARITIVLPVYNAFDLLPEVLERVVAHTDLPWRLIVIEDASSDPQVRPFLRDWAARQRGEVHLIENPRNLGFVQSVNAALAQALGFGDHVVLLNSDALVPAGWASRLLGPILQDPRVASVTPMSNDAEIFSVPVICARSVLEPGMADAIDRVAARLDARAAQRPAPTGVGFCMALNADFLRRLPGFDLAFAPGYGEEVDWCRKADALGGLNLAHPGVFVEHRGGSSFGQPAKLALIAAHSRILSARYPGYDGMVQDFIADDPLLTARLALAVGWAQAWAEAHQTRIPVYLAHSLGGGAELYLARRIARDLAATGRPALVLRVGGPQRWQLELHAAQGRVAGSSDDFDLIARLLEPLTQRELVYSCAVGDRDPAGLPALLLSLRQHADQPLEVLVHDYFVLSPSYTLLDGDHVFRGAVRPGRDAGALGRVHRTHRPDGRDVTLADWQAAWRPLLEAAQDIVVFSQDSGRIMAAVHPDLESRLVLRPHELLVAVPRLAAPSGPRRVLGVLGNIGLQKGAQVVQDLAALVARRPDLGLVVIGNIDPRYAPRSGLTVHGDYAIEELPELAARYGISAWLVPSVWPETFSFTTHEALATGLPVLAFDLGAQGEAVRRAGNGVVLRYDEGRGLAETVLQALERLSR
jgi:GT2 family glycosyltransferase/glycosyltransferase involved in cell wall biosynthesis